MAAFSKRGKIGVAAARSGVCAATASTYLPESKSPSELAKPRTWRTRRDLFAEDWPELETKLGAAPGLRAKTLFDDLVRRKPDAYTPGQLRTLKRRVRQFLALEGRVLPVGLHETASATRYPDRRTRRARPSRKAGDGWNRRGGRTAGRWASPR
ncbi:MAG: hypothetical protein ACUVYA_20930, partial [Planctomycetota bacterium]